MAKLSLDVTSELEDEIHSLFIRSAKEVLYELTKQELHSKEYLSLSEASEYIGISFGTLQLWIKEYGLKYIHIGGKKFIAKSEIVSFMKKYEK